MSDEQTEAVTPAPPAAETPPADTAPSRPRRRGWRWVAPALVLALLVAFGGDRLLHGGRVLRGVRVASVMLGGLDRVAARRAIEELDGRLRTGKLEVKVRAHREALAAPEIGFAVDVERSLERAMAAGRTGGFLGQLGWWLSHLPGGAVIEAVGRLDQGLLARQLDRLQQRAIGDPPYEGGVVVEDGKPRVDAPRGGWIVDRQGASDRLLRALSRGDTQTVELPLIRGQPARTLATAAETVREAERLLAGAVTLVYQPPAEPPPILVTPPKKKSRPKKARLREDAEDAPAEPAPLRFAVTRELLATALRSRTRPGAGYELYFDPAVIDTALAAARKAAESPPRPARFDVTEDDEVRIIPARAGRVVDPVTVAAALLEGARSSSREVALPVQVGAAPEVGTEDLVALDVRGLVSKFTTRHPCCQPRVKNIHRMAGMIDGVVIKPGDTFSINQHVGPRTAEKGFLPAPTIVEGEMEDTLGGGVSQLATTFFNAAFYGGYDIVERAPHTFYFRRYPMGHEATLSYPHPDVVIRNDTASGLLVRCHYTATSITVKLYGHNGGRKVKRKVSRVRDVTKPPIEYEADPKLDPEKEKVIERGQSGWTIRVARVISYPDGKTKEEARKVVYKPRVRKLRVHPCRIPEGMEGHTGEDCPDKDKDGKDEAVEPVEPVEPEPSEG